MSIITILVLRGVCFILGGGSGDGGAGVERGGGEEGEVGGGEVGTGGYEEGLHGMQGGDSLQ